MAIAMPRVRLSKMSTKTAPTTAKGAAPNIPRDLIRFNTCQQESYAPPQKRHNKIVWISLATAVPI